MKTFLTAIILWSLSFITPILAQTSSESGVILWKGIGGKTKWDSTNYILFTASGNDSKYLQNGRKFLINKKSGQARFEGKNDEGHNIIALFNYKTGKLLKLSDNGQEVKQPSADIQELFLQINEQFKKDVAFLFLPVLIDKPDTKTGKLSSKIINAEKLQSLPFQLKSGNLSGELLFSGETGYIKQIVDKEGNEYFVNGYKDIGGGLILPTMFKNMDKQEKSTSFTTVAAFTEMEDTKFSTL